MIKLINDISIFDLDVEALVNPVNTVGVAGAGLAKQFAIRFPKYINDYKNSCKTEIILPGDCRLHKLVEEEVNKELKYIFSFYSKDHWRDKSNIQYISNGLDRLHLYMLKKNISSVGMPAIGCGLGGLDWREVLPLINMKLNSSAYIAYVIG